ncbi:unnamed protein product [Amaranthus hypochondriacus]
MLRMHEGVFELVLIDAYLAMAINIIEFKRYVEEELKIPLVLMTMYNKQVVQKILGLDSKTFIIAKPPPLLDLQNLWQLILSMRITEPIDRNNRRKKVTNNVGGQIAARPPKKRLVWTPKLHRKFLDSIRLLSFNRAVPKKIMQFMNVPGITRSQVASHLQKYKDYLRRICEAKAKEDDVISQNWSHYPIRSNFTMSRFPNLAQHSYLVNYANAKSLMPETTKNNTNHVASPKLGASTSSKGLMQPRTTGFQNGFANFAQPSIIGGRRNEQPRLTYPSVAQNSSMASNNSSTQVQVAQQGRGFYGPNGGLFGNNMDSCDKNGSETGSTFGQPQPFVNMSSNFNQQANVVGNMNNSFGQQNPNMANPINNVYNFGGQTQFAPNMTNMRNFVPNFVENMNNLSNNVPNFVEQPMNNFGVQPQVINNFSGQQRNNVPNFVEQQPPYASNIGNYVGQLPCVDNMSNFVQQQPNIGNMPNVFEQRQYDDDVPAMNEQQQYDDSVRVMNTMHNEFEEQEVDQPVKGANDISVDDYNQQVMVLNNMNDYVVPNFSTAVHQSDLIQNNMNVPSINFENQRALQSFLDNELEQALLEFNSAPGSAYDL